MNSKAIMLALAATLLGTGTAVQATPQVREAAPVIAPLSAAVGYGDRDRDWRRGDRDWRRGDRDDWRRGERRGSGRGWDRRHRGWDRGRGYGYGRYYRTCWNTWRYGRLIRVCR